MQQTNKKIGNLILSVVFGILISFLGILEIGFTPLNAMFIPFGFHGQDIIFLFLFCALSILLYKLGVRKMIANLFIILGIELALLAPIILLSAKLGWFGNIGIGTIALMGFLVVVAVPGFFIGLVLSGIGIFIIRKRQKAKGQKS